MIKVALTHDVDRTRKTYQYFTHPLKKLIKLDLNGLLSQIKSYSSTNNYWGFNEIIKIETKYKIKSTFFFLNETLPFNLFKLSNWKLSLGRYDITHPEILKIIKYLDNNGWEIGLHGSFYSYNNKRLLEKEKEVLENIVGHKIIGIRQHFLNLSKNTWDYQNELGFKYDTSWGYSKQIGYKENNIKYFKPLNNEFLVFPLVIMDIAFVNSKNKWDKFNRLMDITDENDSLLVINWHTNHFNENEFPGFLSTYESVIQKCNNKKAEFKTLGEWYKLLNGNI
jgi:peptidoglycan/xylan/chitin deacetylase (PgdA/CDA1 family)